MSCRSARAPILAAALLVAACDDSSGGAPPPLVVDSVEPQLLVSYQPTTFTISGSGFARATAASILDGVVASQVLPAQQPVTVTFRTDDGTPFEDGTSSTARVIGTVVSDSTITVTSPVTNSPGVWPCTVEVTDALGSATSSAALAAYAGLTVFSIEPQSVRSDTATPFVIEGLSFLPVGGNATVRFTAVAGTFGTGNSLDVPATVTSFSRITGLTPVLPLTAPLRTFVTVFLDDQPGTPSMSSACVLLDFELPPVIPVVVDTITSPLPLAVATPFTITGSGFLGAGSPNVAVTFSATTATPHERGTASTVTVLGTATSDTTVTGTSPTGTAPVDIPAFVAVTRADTVADASASAIVLFTAPVQTVDVFAPKQLPADVSTAFTITGTNLPAAQPATVRFQADEGTPFAGGTSDTADVVATVASATQIDGASPLATTSVAFLAEVTVILQGGIELPMGVVCSFAPGPSPPLPNVVTNLNDSGPGSLRQTVLDANAGATITFDPSLVGEVSIGSTLAVPRSVTIVGPGSDVIRVVAQQSGFPIFTIAAPATAVAIELLTIRGADHAADGGGFVVNGGLTLTRCVVADNRSAGSGAGVFVATGASATLKECTLLANVAGLRGGGAFVQGGGSLAAFRCTFDANEAGAGSGAAGLDAAATFAATNCTFHANTAVGGPGGGAILVGPGAVVDLVHCTLAENIAHNRGGAVLIQGTLNATNCIFARNADGKGDVEVSNKNGTNNTSSSLLRVGTGSDLTNGVNGNLVGTAAAPIEAELERLDTNGGPTKTMALRPGSPALDAATASAVTKDQRGTARPQGPAPDMGAYEATVTL